MQYFYFAIGGLLILSTAIAFLYFILFDYGASGQQWVAAIILGFVGTVFVTIGNDLAKGRNRS